MPYSRLYYHFVWTTRLRLPLINPGIEELVHDLIISRAKLERGIVYAVNGTEDHVHLVVALPPTVVIAKFVKNVKGGSSRFIGETIHAPFRWQEGYGVFTIGSQGLKMVTEYVKRQKERHASGDLIDSLEYSADEDDGPKIKPDAC
jgi:putative transposase